MRCPSCHLINDESAERCDCGYDFKTGRMPEPEPEPEPAPEEVPALNRFLARCISVLVYASLGLFVLAVVAGAVLYFAGSALHAPLVMGIALLLQAWAPQVIGALLLAIVVLVLVAGASNFLRTGTLKYQPRRRSK
jgi:hypothetical protein